MYQFADRIRLEQKFGTSLGVQIATLIGIFMAMLGTVTVVGFGLRYVILAAVDAQIVGEWGRTAADLLAGAFALMALQTLASVPVTILQKLFGKPKPKGHDILEKMYQAYNEIPEHPPLSPQRLRELLHDAARIGAVWPAGLYHLLDDMQTRVERDALVVDRSNRIQNGITNPDGLNVTPLRP